ncbi:hypothetical protein [Patulibacter sp.]|uniref:hypothetical protein n=1 Tax=Patulibacter sp. TaxID=1912859 RepID=UPI0027182FBD|nr:hypothetical protein [Patulibacter sp.]MDO9409418.1 hypothetical protein [Patulibacter sp.]
MTAPPPRTADHGRRFDRPEVAAEHLRERVYGTVTVLASIVTLLRPEVHGDAVGAAVTVVVAVTALWGASLFADLTAHLAVHQAWPRRADVRSLLSSHAQILAVAVLPTILVLSTETGWWELPTALGWAAGGQVLTLALVGLLAVRGTRIPFWGKVFVVGAEVALGLAVVGIKLLGH